VKLKNIEILLLIFVLEITKINVIVSYLIISLGVRKQSIRSLEDQDFGMNSTSSNVVKVGCGVQLDSTTYSNFDRTRILASTPTKETRSPAKKKKYFRACV